ncbi:MAG: hypothetical protein FJW20_13275 [Acidimicrobiia bacterium]|nr:hypothetical protein [Acidimicrobiia bacterium]
MSRYSKKPIDLSGLKTVSLHSRGGKVTTELFAKPHQRGSGVNTLIDSLPHLLAADNFRAVVDALAEARRSKRAILWGLGGHVIKCGLAPILLDLMRRGYATGFSMNGSGAIHDMEIGMAGHTSEDVEAVLPDGSFGSAEETGKEFNRALIEAHRDGIGAGEALGRLLDTLADARFASHSLLLGAWRNATPVTIHIAVGTDTPHTHPAADAAAIGHATHHDFRLFCSLVEDLNDGGVYLNTGSAVIMPEVFLKAVSSVRNLGRPLKKFVTVNFDFLQHYRPRVNVVERPHSNAGGKGYPLTGHHELMIPLLAAALIEREE